MNWFQRKKNKPAEAVPTTSPAAYKTHGFMVGGEFRSLSSRGVERIAQDVLNMSNTELVCFFSSLKKGRRLFSEPRQEWDGLAPDFIKDALKIYKDEIDRRRASGQLTLKMVRSILHPIEQRKRAERAMGNIIKIASSTPKKSGGAFS